MKNGKDLNYEKMSEIISALVEYYPSTLEEIMDILGDEEE